MKKILFLLLILPCNIFAIENIKINNETISPLFDKDIYVYNYFTNEDKILIDAKSSKNELISGLGEFLIDDYNEFIVSSKDKKYLIRVFKNYQNNINESGLESLEILNYDINFNKYIYEYDINISDEDNLNIKYTLSNDNDYVLIEGNGNFNREDNLIKIKVNNTKEYLLHVHKKINKVENNYEEIKTISNIKKETIKVILIIVSVLIIYFFYYVLFVNKTKIHV